MEIQLTQQLWLQLTQSLREEVAKLFSIPLTGVRKVEYKDKPVIVSDGRTYEDLSVVTVNKMQTYLDSSETDFNKLFQMVIAKIEGKNETELLKAKEAAEQETEKQIEESRQKAVETIAKVSEIAGEVLKPRRGRPPAK